MPLKAQHGTHYMQHGMGSEYDRGILYRSQESFTLFHLNKKCLPLNLYLHRRQGHMHSIGYHGNHAKVMCSPSTDTSADSGRMHTSSTRPHSQSRMSLHWLGCVDESALSNSAPTTPGKILVSWEQLLSIAPCTAISNSRWSCSVRGVSTTLTHPLRHTL